MEKQIPADFGELLRRARDNDQTALGALLENYRHYLHLLCKVEIGRHVRGKLDVDDVIQETFISAIKQFEHFRGETEAELVKWLQTILAGTSANQIQRFHGTQKRDIRLEQQLCAGLDRSSQALYQVLAAEESSPSQQAIRRERAVLLANALKRLPGHYQEVIFLSHFEGLSFAEVAQRMGRSLDSVKNLWLRSLAKLRQAFGESL